jgi:preprotein translocase subunit SecA
MKAFFEKLLGFGPDRAIKQIEPIVRQINSLEPSVEALSDAELRAKTDEFKQRLADGENA